MNYELRIRGSCVVKRIFKSVIPYSLFLLLAWRVLPAIAQVSPNVEGLALAAIDPRIIVAKIIRAVLGFLGIVVLVLIIYGGFMWMTAAGNEERIDKAKKILTSAIIGLAVVLSSLAITQFVISRLIAASNNPNQYEIALYQGGGGGLAGQAFTVESIQPQGQLDSKKIIVKIAFSDAVDPDSDSLNAQTIKVSRVDNGDAVAGNLAVGPIMMAGTRLNFSDRVVTFVPQTPCVEATNYFCFSENTAFKVEVVPGGIKRLRDQATISCGLGASTACQSSFTSGTTVDLTPPTVEFRRSPSSVALDGVVELQALAADNSGVALTEFFTEQKCPDQTEGAVLLEALGPTGDTPKNVNLTTQWVPEDSQVVAPSEHELFAKAYDIDSGQTESSRLSVVVRPIHCSNGLLDSAFGETGIDCGGATTACGGSTCGSCPNGPCQRDIDCADAMVCRGDTNTCSAGPPEISGISPGDGKVGTLVSIVGLNFGSTAGKIYFTGASGEVEASAPSQCQNIRPWQDQLVMVNVPAGAQDGPARLVTAAGTADSSNDENGLAVPVRYLPAPRPAGVPADGSFDVNELTHPALCSATSPPQNLPAGRTGTIVNLVGAQFGNQCVEQSCGGVSFGGVPGQGLANWTDTGAQSAVPGVSYGQVGISYGEVRIQMINAQGLASNNLPYQVLSPDAGTMPIINQIICAGARSNNPARGGPGTGCTISGQNFGATPGLVQFIAPDGQVVSADTSMPAQCVKSWWTENSITIKVPRVVDLSDVDDDNNKSELLTSALAGLPAQASGAYKIFVRRYDANDSNKIDFTMTDTQGPYLACIVPSSGPTFTNVTAYGERLGSSVTQGRGLLFTSSNISRASAVGWASAVATLVNIGGVQGDTCPALGWSTEKACAQVPGTARSGDVIVENDFVRGQTPLAGSDPAQITQQSNPFPFRVGSCTDPASGISCGTLTCCPDGTCNMQCSSSTVPVAAYGWSFSTAVAPVVPTVRVFCDAQSASPAEPPSPAPWDRTMGNNVCVNAIVSVGFSTRIENSAASLVDSTAPGFKIDKCLGAENLLNSRNADFETDTGDYLWTPVATGYLTGSVVTNVGHNSNKALLLEKRDNDTGPGWNERNYEHWFGYGIPIISNTNGTTYTASAWMRLNPSSAIQNKKAGILIQRDGNSGVGNTCGGVYPGQSCTTDANCAAMTTPSYRSCLPTPELWMKSSQEIELSTEEWRQVTTTITFDRQGPNSGAPAYARLFLEGDRYDQDENSANARGDFSVYVDDIQVTADPCLRTEPVSINASGSRLEIVQTSIDPETGLHREGFRFSPAAPWSTNSWYRVTLLNTIRGEGDFGQAMQIANDPTPCGYATAAYCFRFKARNTTDHCAVGAIAVSPNPWTALAQNEKIDYSALPLAAGDHCVALNQNLPNWQWSSSAPSKAQVEFVLGHTGHICKTDADCEVGSCLPTTAITKFCTDMGWTTTATALQETEINAQGQSVPARIQARVVDTSGSADLFVQFESPKITQWWPNCGAACTNAEIGGQFNVAMNASTIGASNIELWQMDCGNGRIDTGEDCDDNNNKNGDGCSSQCTREGADFDQQCGDNTIDIHEDCDDDNTGANDGCSAICLNEGVASGQWRLGPSLTGTCGNGLVEQNAVTKVGEECDDGNTTDNDGCSSRCLREGTRSDISICGNGRLETGEECERIGVDDQSRPVFDNQVCNETTCLRKGRNTPVCGNGLIDPGEECDRTFDDNWPPNNLCGLVLTTGGTSTQCLWSGTQRPTVQGGAGCGNGRIDLGEDCDDGNVRPGDGCSATCLNEGSQAITVPACGNNIPEYGAGEDCDDGNVENNDGCSSRCLNEGTTSVNCGNNIKENIAEDCDWALIAQSPSFTNAQAQALCHPTLCTNLGSTTTCGNGVLETGEDCDDDNVVAGDGCSSRCLNEGTTASKKTITPEYNSVERAFGLGMLNLAPNTFYRVLVRGAGLLSAVGKPLQGLNFFYNDWGNANQPPPSELDRGRTANAFSWTFRTSGVMCNIERVELNPQRASLYVIGSRQSYSAAPYGPPDSCAPQGQRLNPLAYKWNWSTGNNAIASIVNYPGVNIIPSCGNGRVEPGEDCDDGNIVSDDGCYGASALEPCTFEGAGFAKACGNERVDLGEECDWPVFCNQKCLLTGTPPCASASDNGICCGNRVRDVLATGVFVEDCDDGNLMAGDNCSPQCLSETKVLLSGTMPEAVCNNNQVEYGEECEDGNLTAGDGCSDKCLLEGAGQNHGTIPEAGPAIGAVLPEALPRIDPYQQAEARGIQKFCRNTSGTFTTTACTTNANCDVATAQVCLPPNPWSTTQVNATARLKSGSAQLTVFCSARTDRDCPTPADSADSGFGDATIGRGSDGCCYNRPTILERQPSGTNVCPNAVFRAVFNTLLDPASLEGKVRLARVRSSACPEGETDLNTGAEYWCAPADTRLGVSLETSTLTQEGINPGGNDLVSVLVMRPSKMLAVSTVSASAEYKILLYGDDNINDQTTAGIKSLTGAAMNGLYSVWNIQTASAPCRLDHVLLEVVPNNTNFNTSGEQRVVSAIAQDNKNEEIESVQDYAWAWSWGSADTEVASVTTVAGQAQTVTAGSKNGLTAINATATITEDTIFIPSTAGEVGDCGTDSRCTNDPGRTCAVDSGCAVPAVRKTGAKDFTVFICDNPWPIDPATGAFTPFIDVGADDDRHNLAITLSGRSPMNFSTYYCRDGETLLPKLSYPGAVLLASSLFPESARPYRMASVDEIPIKLKEFLLTTSTFASTSEVDLVSGKDIIVDSSSAGVETNTLAGSASAYDNADFVYALEFPADGDYELELETSNFEDDLSNLASILDEENISDNLRATLSEDENEYFKLSGAWYHELGVFVDEAFQGTVVNRASGPRRHTRGAVILRSLSRGSHTVRLRWVNDNRLPSRAIAGRSAGSIWDSNLRIYSLRARLGRAEDQAIGIRVMSNPGRRSLRSWYDLMGFQGTPAPYADGVGGYEALQDGNTIYVSAINTRGSEGSTNQTVFGNVYIISLSEGSQPALQAIYNQIVDNLSFNVNLENLRTCAADFCSKNGSRVFVSGDANCGDSVQKVCFNDLDCAVTGQISCQADKDKLKRDLIRLGQLTSVRDVLSAYTSRTGGYPTLEAGTYIRGMSTSRWPSWNATLGAALGIPLPQDPINLYAAGCLPVSSETGTYDQTTCWNETSQTYRCPYGSRIYQYESQGGLGYKFSAELELLERDLDDDEDIEWNVDGWEPLASGNRIISTGGVCSWRAPGDVQWSNAEARCGNRVIETGELCEPGTVEQGTVPIDPATRRCTGNPGLECSLEHPCPDGAGVCQSLTSCVAVRSCRSDCTGWQNWSSGTSASASPVVTDCAAGGTFCGNGVVEGIERCDDGLLNGDYGKCNAECNGFGERCGDGTTNGPEICDDGDDNGGSYNEDDPDRGWCRFDCTGFGPRCGDTEKQEPYEQCEAGNEQISARICAIDNEYFGRVCNSDSDCNNVSGSCKFCGPRSGRFIPHSDTQLFAGGYPYKWKRTCSRYGLDVNDCKWLGFICVAQGTCGDGHPDRNSSTGVGEECDNGQGGNSNTGACTNQCTVARCGDGFIRQDITAEECDAGAQNGVLCDSRYGGTCTYCDRQCNIGTLSGGFCGDRVAQPVYEQCDGLAGLGNWMCRGSIGATEKFWHFDNISGWAAMGDEICDFNLGGRDCNPSTKIERYPGGYHSQSALRISHSVATDSEGRVIAQEGRAGAKLINAVPSTNGTSYTVSAFVNTVDANAYGRNALIALRRTGTTTEDNAQVVLDDDPQTWQYLERTVNFNADPSERPGEIQLFVQSGYTYSVLFDQVHVFPDTDISDNSPENLSCQQANCQGACAVGIVCENVGDNSDRLGSRYGQEICIGEGVSEICLPQYSYINYNLTNPTPLPWSQLISDSIVNSCDNDADNDGDPHGSDCDDHDPTRHHDAIEICGNGIDDNCINGVDECAPVTVEVNDNGTSDDTFCIYFDNQLVGYAYGRTDDRTERTVNISALAPGFHQLKVLFHHQDGAGEAGTYGVNFSSNIRVLNGIDLTGLLRNPAQQSDAIETGNATAVCSETNGTRNVGMADAGSATYMIEVTGGSGGGGGGVGEGEGCADDGDCSSGLECVANPAAGEPGEPAAICAPTGS